MKAADVSFSQHNLVFQVISLSKNQSLPARMQASRLPKVCPGTWHSLVSLRSKISLLSIFPNFSYCIQLRIKVDSILCMTIKSDNSMSFPPNGCLVINATSLTCLLGKPPTFQIMLPLERLPLHCLPTRLLGDPSYPISPDRNAPSSQSYILEVL